MVTIGSTAVVKKQIMTPDLEKKILATQTRQCDNVLRALYQNRLRNKELASHVGISVSSLSNILQRIKVSQLGLLVVEQVGRNTYYSLSELGVQYTEKYLINNCFDKKVLEFDSKKVIDYVEGAITKIQEIKMDGGDDWQFCLDEFLMSYHAATDSLDRDSSYNCLMGYIRQIILDENWEGLNLVYNELENDILSRRIEKLFEKIMGIKSLCILDDNDWKITYEILDDFFQTDGKYINIEFLDQLKENQIDGEDVKKLYIILRSLLDETEYMKLSKKDLYNMWGELFMPHERLLYYFVEKCVNKKPVSG